MCKLKAKIWLEIDSKCLIGEGRAELLENIRNLKSISKAAKSMDMSYSHAWSEVRRIAEAAGGSVVNTCCGGRDGGWSELTDLGEDILERFNQEKKEIERFLVKRNNNDD